MFPARANGRWAGKNPYTRRMDCQTSFVFNMRTATHCRACGNRYGAVPSFVESSWVTSNVDG